MQAYGGCVGVRQLRPSVVGDRGGKRLQGQCSAADSLLKDHLDLDSVRGAGERGCIIDLRNFRGWGTGTRKAHIESSSIIPRLLARQTYYTALTVAFVSCRDIYGDLYVGLLPRGKHLGERGRTDTVCPWERLAVKKLLGIVQCWRLHIA